MSLEETDSSISSSSSSSSSRGCYVVVVNVPGHDATFKKSSSLRQSTNLAASFTSSANGLAS